MQDQLPIDQYLDGILNSIVQHQNMVLRAEPGAGKTTRLPPALLTKFPQKILVLEPRRLATRLAAERIAEERGEECGDLVGYQVRHEKRLSARTRLVFLTEGLLVRQLRAREFLQDVDCVVLDEFHERNIQTDLSLAMLRAAQQRGEFRGKIILMSATIDLGLARDYLGDCAIMDVPGRTFPLRINYLPPAAATGEPTRPEIITALKQVWRDPECPGHILVFLPGMGDIMALAQMLGQQQEFTGAQIVPLSAELPPQQQRLAFATGGKRKIILSTNVAETSVTVPGVTGVVDAGWAKVSGYAPWSGMPTLDLRKISRASAQQRAGRAGRERAGVAYRLYSEFDFKNREEFLLPEVMRTDLSQVILEVMAFGVERGRSGPDAVAEFPWLQPPPKAMLESSLSLLRLLGAIDPDNQMSDFGRRLLAIPLHPRYAALIESGAERDEIPTAILAACMLSEGFVLFDQREQPSVELCDLCYQINLLIEFIYRPRDISSRARSSIDQRRVDAIRRLYRSIASGRGLNAEIVDRKIDPAALAPLLLRAFPDRVARKKAKQAKSGRDVAYYQFCTGRGGRLSEQSCLHAPELLLALDVREQIRTKDAAEGAMIWYGSELSVQQLLDSKNRLITETDESRLNERTGRNENFHVTRYGECLVKEQRIQEENTDDSLYGTVRKRWPQPFENDDDLRAYHVRAKLLTEHGYDLAFPEFSGEMLDLLIADICSDKKSFKEIAQRPLAEYINDQLNYEQQDALRKLTPTQLRLANGRTVMIFYDETRGVYVEAHIQDFYGINQSIKIIGGRFEVTVSMLGPHKRPLQTCRDLAGFWRGAYLEIRKELSRRYPRHFWPEDPATAKPQLHLPRARR